MNIEKQVCSLEYAKKLKELCVPQNSLFVWSHDEDREDVEYYIRIKTAIDILKIRGIKVYDWCSAFTVAELGELLKNAIEPDKFPYGRNKNLYQHYSGFENEGINGGKWESCMIERNIGTQFIRTADTESDARAKMLIYLLENKIITL